MNPKIVSYKDYVAGWLDSSVHDLLEILTPITASSKYALITCLDSNLNPASIRDKSPELKLLAKKMQIVGKGLLLPTDLLLETTLQKRIFFGFDEVWFFPNKNIEPKPDGASIVGPARLTRARFNKLGKWMSANSCSMALGDGDGLNFIIRTQGLAKLLLGFSIEQPAPVFVPAETPGSR